MLDKDALKALGLRANVQLSAQFLATLNESGRVEPMQSASVIGLAISNALATLREKAIGIGLAKFHGSE